MSKVGTRPRRSADDHRKASAEARAPANPAWTFAIEMSKLLDATPSHPQMPRPVIRIAPNPSRLTSRSPPILSMTLFSVAAVPPARKIVEPPARTAACCRQSGSQIGGETSRARNCGSIQRSSIFTLVPALADRNLQAAASFLAASGRGKDIRSLNMLELGMPIEW